MARRNYKQMGRPPKLTPEITKLICQAIRAGNYLEPSCHLAGVGKVTVYGWIKRGRKELDRVSKSTKSKVRKREAMYVDFLNAIKEADAIAETRDVATIAMAAEKQWQAAAWRLERKHFERWGRRATTVHEGGENPIRASVVQYPLNARNVTKPDGDGDDEE